MRYPLDFFFKIGYIFAKLTGFGATRFGFWDSFTK